MFAFCYLFHLSMCSPWHVAVMGVAGMRMIELPLCVCRLHIWVFVSGRRHGAAFLLVRAAPWGRVPVGVHVVKPYKASANDPKLRTG